MLQSDRVGQVALRDFDLGVMKTLGAVEDLTDRNAPSFVFDMGEATAGSAQRVKVFFAQPEQIFRMKVFPFITINRDEVSLSANRYMGVEQMDYRRGVPQAQQTVQGRTGYAAYENKLSAQPYDIIYTLSIFDRYEVGAQAILSRVLRIFPPIGRLNLIDSLGIARSYDAYVEGGIVSLQEAADPVTRTRGYAITIRVEGEIDLADPFATTGVTDFGFDIKRLR